MPPTSTSERPRRGLDALLLLGVCLVSVLPGLGQERNWSSREVRHALIAAEMAARHDSLVPSRLGGSYRDKPPVLHAAAALLYRTFGGPSMLLARLPSALAAILAVLALHRLALALGKDRRLAFAAALGLLGTFGFARMARIARPDMIMVAGILVAVLAVVLAWRRRRGPGRLALLLTAGAAAAVATVTKGPWGLVFPVLALALFRREVPDRRGFGVADALSLALGYLGTLAAWAIPVWLRDDGVYLREVIFQPHLTDPSRYHEGPWHYYLVRGPLAALPLTPFLVLPALDLRRRWSGAAWTALGILLLLSVFPTKRIHYLLPALPFAALAAAESVSARDATARLRRAFLVAAAIGALALPVWHLAIAPFSGRTLEPSRARALAVLERVDPKARILCCEGMGEAVAFLARERGGFPGEHVEERGDPESCARRAEELVRRGASVLLVVRRSQLAALRTALGDDGRWIEKDLPPDDEWVVLAGREP